MGVNRAHTLRTCIVSYVTGPNVYLVTRPAVDWGMVAAFLDDEGLPGLSDSIRAGQDNALATIEVSARLCYMSYGRGRRHIDDFILNLLSSKDGSVFEHVNYGFVFTGVSRSLTHELVRHRAGFAYSQRSQRYVDETEGAFVLPPALEPNGADTEDARRLLDDALDKAADAYVQLTDALGAAAAPRRLRVRHRPPQGHTPGRARRAAQRHRDQDIRHRQRARLASLHRDARRLFCRPRDTPARHKGAARATGKNRPFCSATSP